MGNFGSAFAKHESEPVPVVAEPDPSIICSDSYGRGVCGAENDFHSTHCRVCGKPIRTKTRRALDHATLHLGQRVFFYPSNGSGVFAGIVSEVDEDNNNNTIANNNNNNSRTSSSSSSNSNNNNSGSGTVVVSYADRQFHYPRFDEVHRVADEIYLSVVEACDHSKRVRKATKKPLSLPAWLVDNTSMAFCVISASMGTSAVCFGLAVHLAVGCR